jgi:phytoene desaturase
MTQKTAVVVGGGIAGLASAALLAKAGMKVTLLEAREKVGGRAYIWEKDGFVFDMGPSWYLMPDAFDQFFKLMGTTADKELKLVKLEPAYQTRNEGRDEKLMIVQDLDKNKALFDSIEPGAGAKLQQYLDSAKETYDLSMKHFLYTNFENTKSFTNKEVLGKAPRFLSHLVTSLYAFSGKYVKDERLKKILNFPAVFLGASPYDTPSMYHLMTHVDLNVGVFYPLGGFYTLIEAIERRRCRRGVRGTVDPHNPQNLRVVEGEREVRDAAAIDVDRPTVRDGDVHHGRRDHRRCRRPRRRGPGRYGGKTAKRRGLHARRRTVGTTAGLLAERRCHDHAGDPFEATA